MAIALVASLLSEIRFGTLRVPVVVWEMVFGILIGPYALGVVRPGGFMQWFGQGPGLAALFFMAGMELDLQKLRVGLCRLRFAAGSSRSAWDSPLPPFFTRYQAFGLQ
jgi:Kef-type K+ transport system membrane component KefB